MSLPYLVGCNYWASHAGTEMWACWDEATVDRDFSELAKYGVRVLRVFPNWRDFQPIHLLRAGSGEAREYRMHARTRLTSPYDLDRDCLEHFHTLCHLAEKHGIRLLVSIVTGWMSGRLFVPEMLQERNTLTDPLAIQWEIRFVRLMVRLFHDKPAIAAWDLGNECNCLGKIETSEQAYVWAATISMAIRCEDAAHPIVSGMHGLSPSGAWRMQDQPEFLDVLCTHPYPIFTPHCDTDPLNQMKSALHATAESLYYGNIGGKPCFAEETGVLGPMVVSDEYAADYIRAAMLSLLAHDCGGMLWWCGFEQSALTRTPYDWNGVERELGLFYLDKSPKPVVKTMTAFSELVESLPFDHLPARIVDAVCILTRGQDSWAAAYGAFILAKQAHIDLTFAWADGPIPEAKAYLLPSMHGDTPLNRSVQAMLMERVKAGARLYWSLDGALLSPFSALSGLRVLTRAHHPQTAEIELGGRTISLTCEFRMRCESIGAEVLARTQDGEIAFAKNSVGAGEIYTLLFSLEDQMASRPGMVDSEQAQPGYLFYEAMNLRSPQKLVQTDCPTIGLTEHVIDDTHRVLVAINHEPYDQTVSLHMDAAWHCTACCSIDGSARLEEGRIALRHNDGAVLMLEKAAR